MGRLNEAANRSAVLPPLDPRPQAFNQRIVLKMNKNLDGTSSPTIFQNITLPSSVVLVTPPDVAAQLKQSHRCAALWCATERIARPSVQFSANQPATRRAVGRQSTHPSVASPFRPFTIFLKFNLNLFLLIATVQRIDSQILCKFHANLCKFYAN